VVIFCGWISSQQKAKRLVSTVRHSLYLRRHTIKKTGLLICCPVSTSIRGAATEVPVQRLDCPSVVAANLIQTLSWKQRKAKMIAPAEDGVVEQVLLRLLPLNGAAEVLENVLGSRVK